jgi:Flp pilus assembly protein TadD
MAAQLYQASVRYQPKDAHLRYLWAHSLAAAGDNEGAITQARHSLTIDPSQPEAMTLLGILLRRQGDNKEAIDLFERAWNASPRSWVAGRELGEWYAVRGDSARAKAIVSLVAERFPEDRQAQALLARLEESPNDLSSIAAQSGDGRSTWRPSSLAALGETWQPISKLASPVSISDRAVPPEFLSIAPSPATR